MMISVYVTLKKLQGDVELTLLPLGYQGVYPRC